MDDALYGQLEQAMLEVANAKHESYQETFKRVKAEREAIDAVRKVIFLC